MKKGNIINQSAEYTHAEVQTEMPSMSMEVKNDSMTLKLSSSEILLFMSMMLVLVLGTIAGMVWFARTIFSYKK